MQNALRIVAVALVLAAIPASAQSFADGKFGVRGFGSFGNISFQAADSFDAVLGRNAGPIFGGGGQVLLPWGFYFDVGAWKFQQDGERVFVGPDREVFRLGIPVEIAIIPLEVTGGWRFRKWQRFVPYGGIGYSSYRYKETSEFSDPSENVDETFTGYHLVGGAEYLPLRWLAVGGEVGWSSIEDALGAGGASAAFGETNLGGTSVRLKISVGR